MGQGIVKGSEYFVCCNLVYWDCIPCVSSGYGDLRRLDAQSSNLRSLLSQRQLTTSEAKYETSYGPYIKHLLVNQPSLIARLAYLAFQNFIRSGLYCFVSSRPVSPPSLNTNHLVSSLVKAGHSSPGKPSPCAKRAQRDEMALLLRSTSLPSGQSETVRMMSGTSRM